MTAFLVFLVLGLIAVAVAIYAHRKNFKLVRTIALVAAVITLAIAACNAAIVRYGTGANGEASIQNVLDGTGVDASAAVDQPQDPAAVDPVAAANMNTRVGGMVENNYDGGDFGNYTNIAISRNDPTSDIANFLVYPKYSIDIEYVGKMYFTADNFYGETNLEVAVQLAAQLHPEIKTLIFVGPKDKTPKGYTYWEDAKGWWTLADWKYSEKVIEPEGLTNVPLFVTAEQTNREITSKTGVLYCQFWTPANPGYVVHTQVQTGKIQVVPANWQGTCWDWTGDFSKGMLDLQKRMIQASAKEVVNRDDILGIQMLTCGPLPEVAHEFNSFQFKGQTVNWLGSLEGWTCK